MAWNQIHEAEETAEVLEIYGLPCGIGTKSCTTSCTQRLPFWPRLESGRKGKVGVSQTTLCSQNSAGEHLNCATETRM